MPMRRRSAALRVALSAALLVLPMFSPAEALAVQQYNYPCASSQSHGDNDNTFQTYTVKTAGTYRGLIMNLYPRWPTPCYGLTGSSPQTEAQSMLLTLQGPGLNHLGFALCADGIYTCSFDASRTNQVHFVYAINNGVLIDVGQQAGLPEIPVSNHQYRFRMEYATCGTTPCVRYNILDRTLGETSYHTFTKNRNTSSDSDLVWWGYETHYSGSVMGVPIVSAGLYVEDMQILTTGASSYVRISNLPAPTLGYSVSPGLAYPIWYNGYMENGPYPPQDRMQIVTRLH